MCDSGQLTEQLFESIPRLKAGQCVYVVALKPSAGDDVEIESIFELEDFDECWNEWLATDNEYAVHDRLSMNAGAGRYMNFVAMALKRK